jgi:predicted ATPase
LALPNLTESPSLEALSQYTAVALFIQRAQAVKPDFRLTEETAPAVAEICRRLDGLPLAIELAAARIKLLSPSAMLIRLEHRLKFLTGGARDLPTRQQTLRNAIAWSYDLLDENEQKVFRRLSVFVGGCTMEAAETITQADQDLSSILDQLESLLDKSLLREVGGMNNEPRFFMLEMLREFGLEQLEASRRRSGAVMPSFSCPSRKEPRPAWSARSKSNGWIVWSRSTATCALRSSGVRRRKARRNCVCV